MTENYENLEELLSRFLDKHQIHEAAEDIRLGEELLASFGGPAPDKAVIDGIKAQIEVSLEARKKRRLARSVFYRVAVAAAIVVLAIAGARFFTGPERKATGVASAAYASIWDDENGPAGDEQLAALITEIDEIEASMLAIRLGENGTEGGMILTDLEVEISEINGDFWKG